MAQEKDWSASQYLKFSNERTRPVYDLLSQVTPHITSPTPRIYDLGCGPGNSTRVLLDAFPNATITGLDSSPDMLEKATSDFSDSQNVDFVTGDVGKFELEGGTDLLFSNAVFHWLRSPTRLRTLARLFQSMQKGGVIAIQVPDNYHKATHKMMRKTALMRSMPWSSAFASSNIGDLEEKERPDLDPIEGSMMWYDALVPYAEHVRSSSIYLFNFSFVFPADAVLGQYMANNILPRPAGCRRYRGMGQRDGAATFLAQDTR
jgi:trans-aconitate 2-methyltransferase